MCRLRSALKANYQPKIQGDLTEIEKAVALMAGARKGVIYSGRRRHQFRSGRLQAAARTGRAHGFPITSTMMGLGAYPASGPAWLGNARHARHLRGQYGHA